MNHNKHFHFVPILCRVFAVTALVIQSLTTIVCDAEIIRHSHSQHHGDGAITKPSPSSSSHPEIFSVAREEEKDEERWRDGLPPQLQKRRGALHRLVLPTGVTRQKYRGEEEHEEVTCVVYLLGTAHVSKDSCADAKILMEIVRPDVLFVELCNQRISLLEDDRPPNDGGTGNQRGEEGEEGEDQSIRQMYRGAVRSDPNLSKTAALSSVLLSKIQGDYATKLGVSIGGEFREAFRVAKAQQTAFQDKIRQRQWGHTYGIPVGTNTDTDTDAGDTEDTNGCAVVLGDRPVRLTLSRAYESLSILGRIKLILGLLWSSFKQPDMEELQRWIELILNDPDGDVLSDSIKELAKHFPTIKETIIHERDTYMACKLLQTAAVLGAATVEDGKTRTIVAVVGAGHCPGITERIRRAKEERCDERSVGTIDSLRRVVETKKIKLEDSEELRFLVEEVASISL